MVLESINSAVATAPRKPMRRLAAALAIVAGAWSVSGAAAAEFRPDAYRHLTGQILQQLAAGNSDEFRIVDCLLPGQLRKLGRMSTFVTARRPIKTSVGDCEIRGGEYVAEDRGGYAHALKVWLPMAKQGDPKAQTFLGEIFEKGLGLEPNYQTAAEWYRRAAEQGYSAAQINLGNLYEKGLGVPRDPRLALEWYRKATGLGEAGLDFVPAGELRQLRSDVARGKAETEELRGQVRRLQDQLDRTRRQLEQRRGDAAKQSRQIDQANRALAAERAKYARERQELQGQRRRLERLEAQYDAKVESSAQAMPASIEQRLREEQEKAAALQKALTQAREALARQEASPDREREIEAERARLAQVEADYRRQLQALEQARRETESTMSREHQSQAAALRQELNEMRTRLEQSEARIAKQNAEMAAREREIAAKEDQLARLDRELKQLTQQAESRRTELTKLNRRTTAEAPGDAPTIELIDPKLQMATRGLPVATLRGKTKTRVIVGRVRSAAGLMTLVVNDREQKFNAEGIFQSTVPILPKGTRVSIVAIDKRGKKSDLEFLLQPAGASANGQALVSNLDNVLKLPDVNFGTFHALVIGNDNYRNLPKLETAINDAKSVAGLLRDRYGFKVKLLLDATRYDILSALNELRKTLTEKDNLLVYYAGHGELDKVNQRGHWLPVDAEPASTANWISNVSITDMLNAMTAKHVMVVADSCYSGALTRSALARLEAGMSKEARATWVGTIIKRRSRVALTSGGLQPVLDAGGGQHSIFAKAFIDVLKKNRGVLEARRVHQEVSARVTYAADALRYDQLPEYAPIKHAGHGGGEFFFVARGA